MGARYGAEMSSSAVEPPSFDGIPSAMRPGPIARGWAHSAAFFGSIPESK